MKELYLIGFILTYVAFFVKKNESINNLEIEKFKLSKTTLYGLLLLPLLFITKNGIEHISKILSVVFGLISLTKIIKAESPGYREYIHSITLSSMLVSIYNNSLLKSNVIPSYIYYMLCSLLMTSNNVSNLSNIVSESLLIHLIFFFTK